MAGRPNSEGELRSRVFTLESARTHTIDHIIVTRHRIGASADSDDEITSHATKLLRQFRIEKSWIPDASSQCVINM
jgi:hypothetical protein